MSFDETWRDFRRHGARLVDVASDYQSVHRAMGSPDHEAYRTLRARFGSEIFASPTSLNSETLDAIISAAQSGTLKTGAAQSFGLFNPALTGVSVLGAWLVALVNPQVASRDFAPFFHDAEMDLARYVAGRLWHPIAGAGGTFTSGGAESNLIAAMAAVERLGRERTRMFCCESVHPTVLRAARLIGIDVERIPPDEAHRLDATRLSSAILGAVRWKRDIRPLVVATVGETTTGAIDEVASLVPLVQEYGGWLHVDAAWAGALLLSDQYRDMLGDLSGADSVIVDPHKWLCVPEALDCY